MRRKFWDRHFWMKSRYDKSAVKISDAEMVEVGRCRRFVRWNLMKSTGDVTEPTWFSRKDMRSLLSGLVRCLRGWAKKQKNRMKNNTKISWNPYPPEELPSQKDSSLPTTIFRGYVKLRGRNPFMASKSCYVFVRFCKLHSWHAPETGSQLLEF